MPERAFDYLGHALTRSMIDGDFALFHSVMVLPLRIVPRGGASYVLPDEAALLQDFNLYHRALKTAGVTDIYRQVDNVQEETSGVFRVFYAVHVMARAHRITDPFRSEILMLPGPQGLRISEIVSTPDHFDWMLGRTIGPGSGLI